MRSSIFTRLFNRAFLLSFLVAEAVAIKTTNPEKTNADINHESVSATHKQISIFVVQPKVRCSEGPNDPRCQSEIIDELNVSLNAVDKAKKRLDFVILPFILS